MKSAFASLFAAAAAAVSAMLATAFDAVNIIPATVTRVEKEVSLENALHAYAFNGCTNTEIADRFLVEESFVRERFANELRSARGLRKFAIRKAQTEVALGKNGSVLIWIGRNELGQSLNPSKPGEREPEMDAKEG